MVRILEEYNFPVNELYPLERNEIAEAPMGLKDQAFTCMVQ